MTCARCLVEKNNNDFPTRKGAHGILLRKQCKLCVSIVARHNRLKNIEQRRATRKIYASTENGREAIRRGTKKWDEKNKERIAKLKKIYCSQEHVIIKRRSAVNKYRINNKPKCAEYQSRIRAKKRSFYKGLSKAMKKEIIGFYNLAKELSKEYKEKYVVDHYYPINGKNSSGLHVPWNLQVIKHSENVRKSNISPDVFYN